MQNADHIPGKYNRILQNSDHILGKILQDISDSRKILQNIADSRSPSSNNITGYCGFQISFNEIYCSILQIADQNPEKYDRVLQIADHIP